MRDESMRDTWGVIVRMQRLPLLFGEPFRPIGRALQHPGSR
jgi:hypothetical protein